MILSVVNQKGGVGKTTTSTNLATALAACDHKVLLMDLDPQGNASTGFGIDHDKRRDSIYDVFQGRDVKAVVARTAIPGLDIIPSNMDLVAAEMELVSARGREFVLKDKLSELGGIYDYVIIDCPPSLGLLTLNALVASDKVLIPMQCEFYAMEGLSHLLKTIELIRKGLNAHLAIEGILLTMYDKRNRLTEQIEQDIRSCMGDLVFKSVIPRNVRISEAPSYGKPVMIYDHKCVGAMSYMLLAREILEGRYETKRVG